MPKSKLHFKKIIPLLASLLVVSGPILLVTACNNNTDINRYPGTLPGPDQDRLLFSFNNVNFNFSAKDQFNSDYKNGLNFITQKVEYIMAQQNLFDFFKNKIKLKATDDQIVTVVNNLIDQVGLKILENDYYNSIKENNDATAFDVKVENSQQILFQTNAWATKNTTQLEYKNVDFYNKNNNDPNLRFDPNENTTNPGLYSQLDDNNYSNQLLNIAKHPDENFINDLGDLQKNNKTWEASSTGPIVRPLFTGSTVADLQKYQKKLNRFNTLLRFRYQPYYRSTIYPQLGPTLLTFSNILNSIFNLTNTGSDKPTINVTGTNYAQQLQNWDTGSRPNWSSHYRLTYDYTVKKNLLNETENNINNSRNHFNLMDKETFNPDFFQKLSSRGSNETIKTPTDPIFGGASYINGKSDYDTNDALKDNNSDTWKIPGWAKLGGIDFHYTQSKNKTEYAFVYAAPIYWIDVVNNLNFDYLLNPSQMKNENIRTTNISEDLSSAWNSQPQANTDLSKFIRGASLSPNDVLTSSELQAYKWSSFWQMLWYLSDSNSDNNTNSTKAGENFTASAKILFPEYIDKRQVYDQDFWSKISQYYS